MFEAEADGLRELQSAHAIRVPEVVDCGVRDGRAFLAIERFEFDRPTTSTERKLGEQLAALHRHTERRFGWFRDNTIGLTPQINDWSNDWLEFYRRHQMAPEVWYRTYGENWVVVQSSLQDWVSCFKVTSLKRHCCTAIYGAVTGEVSAASRYCTILPCTTAIASQTSP